MEDAITAAIAQLVRGAAPDATLAAVVVAGLLITPDGTAR
jgi:hypothetical protein